MGIQLNKESYEKLINENIDWLNKSTIDQPHSLEKRHIIDILKASINLYYENKHT